MSSSCVDGRRQQGGQLPPSSGRKWRGGRWGQVGLLHPSLCSHLDPCGSHLLEANSDCDGATEPHGSTHAHQNEDQS